MNDKLLLSSLLCGIIILSFEYTVLTLSIIITYIGIITSILNHGLSNKYCKWIDRLMMGLAAIVYFCNSKLRIYVIINIILYLLSKKYKNDNLHILTHILTIIIFYLGIKEQC